MKVIEGGFKRKPALVGELAAAIVELVYKYSDMVSVAEAIGAIELAKQAILDEQK